MKGPLVEVNVEIHCIKEPDYIMMPTSSYGTLERVGVEKKRIWTRKGAHAPAKNYFKYPELVHNNFQY